jgi:hypothetical protein
MNADKRQPKPDRSVFRMAAAQVFFPSGAAAAANYLRSSASICG